MSAPLWKWDWDYLWHFLGGLAITVVVLVLLELFAPIPSWLVVVLGGVSTVLLAVIGWVREKSQHEWNDLTPHQVAEAVLWPIGSAVGLGLAVLVGKLAEIAFSGL